MKRISVQKGKKPKRPKLAVGKPGKRPRSHSILSSHSSGSRRSSPRSISGPSKLSGNVPQQSHDRFKVPKKAVRRKGDSLLTQPSDEPLDQSISKDSQKQGDSLLTQPSDEPLDQSISKDSQKQGDSLLTQPSNEPLDLSIPKDIKKQGVYKKDPPVCTEEWKGYQLHRSTPLALNYMQQETGPEDSLLTQPSDEPLDLSISKDIQKQGGDEQESFQQETIEKTKAKDILVQRGRSRLSSHRTRSVNKRKSSRSVTQGDTQESFQQETIEKTKPKDILLRRGRSRLLSSRTRPVNKRRTSRKNLAQGPQSWSNWAWDKTTGILSWISESLTDRWRPSTSIHIKSLSSKFCLTFDNVSLQIAVISS